MAFPCVNAGFGNLLLIHIDDLTAVTLCQELLLGGLLSRLQGHAYDPDITQFGDLR